MTQGIFSSCLGQIYPRKILTARFKSFHSIQQNYSIIIHFIESIRRSSKTTRRFISTNITDGGLRGFDGYRDGSIRPV